MKVFYFFIKAPKEISSNTKVGWVEILKILGVDLSGNKCSFIIVFFCYNV